MTENEATKVARENPDFLIQDLFDAVEGGNYPIWDGYNQVMDPKETEGYKWKIF